MARKIAWLLIVAGVLLLGYNAYQWWGEIRVAVVDPKMAMAISKEWDDRTRMPSLDKGEPVTGEHAKKGTVVGQLVIPRLGAILPIVQGTDADSLKKGVGLYEGYGTVNPGETGHVVLSGHRDTVFRGVGKLQTGDRLYVKYHHKVFTYQIRKTWITKADDLTVIVPIPRPVLSLTTCYPFNYVGSAPDRYIIRADLIKIENENQKDTQTLGN
ncbi:MULTISPECIES: class D sortase [unclassified Thermoactinomyces]|jgi:sortase A|uniref:class D sortase n=1 Tax=unclassified Thermoactinomyces TaxID=2634588 RepID=UPI0018DB4D34|nr:MULTISPECIES: class D sortase [unclassified Thermoactinomyces]MBH8598667.1 class D sortase [Thermoactinomyces sp. CICC 10523]MBH8606331.1 class D sortase [Thermoactinomyces sp. CICC 10521]